MDEIYKKEFDALVRYYESEGGDSRKLTGEEYASLVVNGNKVLHSNSAGGIHIHTVSIRDGVRAEIVIDEGYRAKYPVHLCFGMLPREGRQKIVTKIRAGRGSSVKFLSHCIFPNAVSIEHIMESEVEVGEGAFLEYEEVHIHSKTGNLYIEPKTRAIVKDGGEYNSGFVMKTGKAGTIRIDYEVHLQSRAKSELSSKIYGREDDDVLMRERLYLEGDNSRGLIKTRTVMRGHSRSEVVGEVIGEGANSRGHVDCMEIIMEEAEAFASPVVVAKNPSAKVTHEAAIGSVDKKQLLTLMARGLSEEEAVDMIVGGLLR